MCGSLVYFISMVSRTNRWASEDVRPSMPGRVGRLGQSPFPVDSRGRRRRSPLRFSAALCVKLSRVRKAAEAESEALTSVSSKLLVINNKQKNMTKRTIVTLMLAVAMLMPAVGYAQGNGGTKKKKTEQTTAGKPIPKPQTRPKPGKRTDSSGGTSNLDPVIKNLISNMVYVEGGSFMMGSAASGAHSYEKPVHREPIGSFSIGRYEVTQREWKAVMGSNPSEFKGDDLPVEQVSWDDCKEFIRKLNAKTGKNFRLPTEAEWEYAARGGNRSKGYLYSGSDNIEEVAWFYDNSGSKTHPVGTKAPNELELYDMSGNVWEWTSDNSSDDYNSPRDRSTVSIRGGCWFLSERFCRVWSRGGNDPAVRSFRLGLRLAL